MDDRLSKEAKLNAAKDIVSSYLKTAVIKENDKERPALSPDEVCALFEKVYRSIEQVVPAPEGRKIGLGV